MQNSQEVYPLGWELFDEKNKRLAVLKRKEEHQKQVRQIVEEKRKSGREISIGQGIAIVGTALFLIAGSVAFLNQSQALTQNARKISDLSAQYAQLVSNNNDLEKQIEADIDYEEIYDRAVNEFGMTYPNKDQVVGFEKEEGPYVRQEEFLP